MINMQTQISDVIHTVRFWNNLHHVGSTSKDWKTKWFKVFGARKPKVI